MSESSDIQYDVIVVGAGIAGLYAAHQLTNKFNLHCCVLESESRIGGRTWSEEFYGSRLAVGAGVGRFHKDKLLYKLVKSFDLPSAVFTSKAQLGPGVVPIDIARCMSIIKRSPYFKTHQHDTFQSVASHILGRTVYKQFLVASGYRDFELDDAYEVVEYYEMDDNDSNIAHKYFSVPWKDLLLSMAKNIPVFKNSKVVKITHESKDSVRVLCANGKTYLASKVVLATPVNTLEKLLPSQRVLLHKLVGYQPFLRVYAKFDKTSRDILLDTLNEKYTLVRGPLQKIIPMNSKRGVYMIAYCDNKNARKLRPYIGDTQRNRIYMANLVSKALKIDSALKIRKLKSFYWPLGTHYPKPYKTHSKAKILRTLANPEDNIFVVGEAVARTQGWSNGALETVANLLCRQNVSQW